MIDTFLSDLYGAGVIHDSEQADRSTKRLNITPETGAFLAILLQESRPSNILEVGTSNGYSTIWLARTCASIGSNLVSLDSEVDKTAQANENLTQVGLIDSVELITMDAGTYLKDVEDRSFDFIFLDAARSHYVEWWSDIQRVLDWGILVVDNAISHHQELHSFLELIRADPELDQVVLPIGKGQLVVTKIVA